MMKVGLDSKQLKGEELPLKALSRQVTGSGFFIAFWLYGAVEPLTGESFFWQFSHVDTESSQQFLNEFAASNPDSLNIIQVDNGLFHKAKKFPVPENIILWKRCMFVLADCWKWRLHHRLRRIRPNFGSSISNILSGVHHVVGSLSLNLSPWTRGRPMPVYGGGALYSKRFDRAAH